jgi:hypothetical protein
MAPTRSRASTLATFAVASALVGCGGSGGVDPPFVQDFDVSVVVEGTVLDLDAEPVLGVTVRISVYHFVIGTGCTAQLVGPPTTAIMTEEGNFSKTVVYTLDDPDIEYVEACITIDALPPTGYFGDSRSNLSARLKRLPDGVEVIEGVDLVLVRDPA